MASGPITSWQTDGETVESGDFIFGGSKITADGDCSHEIKMLPPERKAMTQPRQLIKKQRHYFTNKGPSSQGYGFSSSHDGCESWTIKKVEHWRTDAFEWWCWRRLLESPLDCKEIQPVHPKGNQSWTFIGRTDTEAETPILWPPDAKNWLTEKDPDTGENWRQEKGTTEDEMVGWHHRLNGTWVWASSESWGWTGKPGVLQSMGSQRIRHDWATELNWNFNKLN